MERYILETPYIRNKRPPLSMQGWGRRLTITAVMLYVFCFAAWRLLVASPLYDRWWPLQVSELFGLWSIAPLPFLFIAVVIWRSRWLWIALLVPLLWFGNAYGGLFLPRTTPVASAIAGGATLRVMTFNTWREDDRHGEFATAVEEWQPDLIALQEVSARFHADLEELDNEWPYQARASVRERSHIAILSKVPFVVEEGSYNRLGCHCVQAVLDWNGEAVRVIVVHVRAPEIRSRDWWGIPFVMNFDASNQDVTYGALAPRIEASPEPLIVLGDFNTTERQPGYQLLYGLGLEDAHAAAGWGFGLTFPAPKTNIRWLPISLIRIDHIFYDAAWHASKVWSTPLMGSDHQAVVADLRWVGYE